MFSSIIGALVEAWGEVKVQRARVVLSLVGVTAAVAAMATVIAIGDLLIQSERENQEAWSGREVTLTISAYQSGDAPILDDACATGDCSTYADGTSDSPNPVEQDVIVDPLGQAMLTVAERFDIRYWSRVSTAYDLQIKEFDELVNFGTFHGAYIDGVVEEWSSPEVYAVDPDYAVLYRLRPSQGRWLASGDVNQRVTPVVINSTMWELFGKPDISVPTTLTFTRPEAQTIRIVGVVPAGSTWDSPRIYMPYDSWQLMKPSDVEQGAIDSTAAVWVGPDNADEARTTLPAAVAAVLGDDWTAEAYGGEQWDDAADQLETVRLAIMGIGGIVILLGALGLLNVAVVTVRQRVREIGIRRAVGASAGRVFFAVFMESVVATFVAGIVGVGIAVIVTRYLPLESMGIMLQNAPTFPMSAAIAGIGIATGVGALCGIIPAIAAVKVRPIDAIRY